MSKNFSASRIGCFTDCILKYKFTYVDGLKRSDDEVCMAALKGSCFHETVEHYHTGMSKEEITSLLEKNIEKYGIYAKEYLDENGKPIYNEHEALERFLVWWERFVKPLEEQGYKFSPEEWKKMSILRQPFVGALDVQLMPEIPGQIGKPIYIVDYKSGKTTDAQKYKKQQLLYAYFIGRENGWDFEETARNVKCYIFFPFAEPGRSPEIALRLFKEIKYDSDDLRYIIEDYYGENIKKILGTDWSTIGPDSGTESFGCNWCPFAGAPASENFCGCNISKKFNKQWPEGVKIISVGD